VQALLPALALFFQNDSTLDILPCMTWSRKLRTPTTKRSFDKGLIVSLAANVALGCAIAWLLLRPSPNSNIPSAGAAPAVSLVAAPVAQVSPNKTQTAAPPASAFSWSQLQAPEFPEYISRLRGVACPEPTVRFIIKGELDEIYADKKQQAIAAHGEIGRKNFSVTLRRELDNLTAEEDLLLAQLLGLSVPGDLMAGTRGGTPEASPPAAMRNLLRAQPLAMPLAFREVDTAALPLSPDQAAQLEQMRADFLKMIGGANQNPSDPQYMTRWRRAQNEMDLRMRTALGDNFMAQYQAHLK
jgi:hypothetical protein